MLEKRVGWSADSEPFHQVSKTAMEWIFRLEAGHIRFPDYLAKKGTTAMGPRKRFLEMFDLYFMKEEWGYRILRNLSPKVFLLLCFSTRKQEFQELSDNPWACCLFLEDFLLRLLPDCLSQSPPYSDPNCLHSGFGSCGLISEVRKMCLSWSSFLQCSSAVKRQ